jgi:hypothetical protein
MSVIGNPLLLSPEGYQIDRSVRLRRSASAYLNRTVGSASNRKTWTWSGWVKRGTLSAQQGVFGSNNSATYPRTSFYFTSSDTLQLFEEDGTGANITVLVTTQVFRDPSAWYHVVLARDTTAATSSDRVKLYVNGVQITSFSSSTYPTLNFDGQVNNTSYPQTIGRTDGGNYLDGYLADVNFIDGQALTPSSFGETDAVTGVWKPKKYAGTYGTNGFYLNFSDPSSTTTIGYDYSGNGNNWTSNNISVTAGVTYDSMIDTPTPYADGGNGRGNYCVLNALSKMGTPTNSAANLQTSLAASSLVNGSQVVSSGKWYYEAQFTSGSDAFIGWNRVDLQTGTGNSFQQAGSLIYLSSNGSRYKDGDGGAVYGASYTTSDAIGCAIDLDNNQVTWYKNNVSQGTISITAGNYAPCLVTGGTACNFLSNFGQRPFAYTPPTGFKALNTQNLPEPTIVDGSQYFDATTYTGNGTTQSIVNSGGMQPDLVWIKRRSAAADHALYDSSRTLGVALASNSTGAEGAVVTNGLMTAYNSDGFSVAVVSGDNTTNGTANTFVGWQWKANGAGVSNTDGSITSTVSAGVTQGFSVVTYTGTGSNATVGHGLGVAPKMVIVKNRSGTNGWAVGHNALDAASPWNYFLVLEGTDSRVLTNLAWNNTAPTSSVFSLGTGTRFNANTGTYVAYCFAEVPGFSKFGSYTGNGSTDGPFVHLGFRPAYVMIKVINNTYDWEIADSSRSSTNFVDDFLVPNSSAAENANVGAANSIDFLSNGFKIRANWTRLNDASGTFIYMAFAEHPFKNALAR